MDTYHPLISAKRHMETAYVIIRLDEVSTVKRGRLICFWESPNQKVQKRIAIDDIILMDDKHPTKKI